MSDYILHLLRAEALKRLEKLPRKLIHTAAVGDNLTLASVRRKVRKKYRVDF
jgi:hypothetical protein